MWLEVLKYVSVIISSGIWIALIDLWKTKRNKKSADKQMLLGLGHDRIYESCSKILDRGWVTIDELENLEYLFVPYKKLGGNGTAERLMDLVVKLPHHKSVDNDEKMG